MHRSNRIASVSAVCMLALLATVGCKPAPVADTYVALGDSGVAGPLIAPIDLTSPGCFRSDANYPTLLAPRIDVERFIDVSCSGAMINHLTEPMHLPIGGSAAPQLDVLDERTKVVTLSIGGNDTPWIEAGRRCFAKSLDFFSSCQSEFIVDGRDTLKEIISGLAPRFDAAFAEIARRAPNAELFVVSYPLMLGAGSSCYPVMPVVPADAAWLNSVDRLFHDVQRASAEAAGATFVDVQALSAGHDICSADRWVEGLIPTSIAVPFHANAAGHRAYADFVTDAINAKLDS